jgi:hypothetical protein
LIATERGLVIPPVKVTTMCLLVDGVCIVHKRLSYGRRGQFL